MRQISWKLISQDIKMKKIYSFHPIVDLACYCGDMGAEM